MYTEVSKSLSLAAVGYAQFICVTACDGGGVIDADNFRDCCITNNGGGFVTDRGSCTSCTPFRGRWQLHTVIHRA